MSLRTVALGAMMLSLPVVVEVPATTDSAGGETRVTLIGGAGRYAIIDRGCESNVIHPARFREAGASIERRTSKGLVLGVRGGAIHDTREVRDNSTYPYRDSVEVVRSDARLSYVNPFLAYEARGAGVGVGFLAGNRPARGFTFYGTSVVPERPLPDRMSFHIRLGRLDRTYFSVSHLENVPLWTGGSEIDLGFGGRPHPRLDVYWGLAGGQPFDGPGLSLRTEYRVLPHWALTARARLGRSEGTDQNAFALGLTYSSRAPASTGAGSEPSW